MYYVYVGLVNTTHAVYLYATGQPCPQKEIFWEPGYGTRGSFEAHPWSVGSASAPASWSVYGPPSPAVQGMIH